MKLSKEFTEWDELESAVLPVDRKKFPELHSIATSSGAKTRNEIRYVVEDFLRRAPDRAILLPFTNCHRLVMDKSVNASKLMAIDINHEIGYIASASYGFACVSKIIHGEWWVRGIATVGGVSYALMVAQNLTFVRAAHLSGNKLNLQGTGAAQQHYTTGCSRAESAIVSACCVSDNYSQHPLFINLTIGGTL